MYDKYCELGLSISMRRLVKPVGEDVRMEWSWMLQGRRIGREWNQLVLESGIGQLRDEEKTGETKGKTMGESRG